MFPQNVCQARVGIRHLFEIGGQSALRIIPPNSRCEEEANSMSSYTVVTRNGQMTIPVAVRKALGIEDGDRVELTLTDADQRRATLQRVPSVTESTYGIAQWEGDPIDVAEFDRVFEEEVVAEAMRELGAREGGS
jgi:AbrB family looped-hinge helix DNA binding protein